MSDELSREEWVKLEHTRVPDLTKNPVETANLVVRLVGHIKNQDKKTVEQDKKIESLEKEIDELEGKLDEVHGSGFYDKADDHSKVSDLPEAKAKIELLEGTLLDLLNGKIKSMGKKPYTLEQMYKWIKRMKPTKGG